MNVNKSQLYMPHALNGTAGMSHPPKRLSQIISNLLHQYRRLYRFSAEGEPLVIVLSRSRNGLCSESQKRVDAALEANNICKDNLESFDVSDCADIYDYCFN
ncbi:hypothetical protein J6590_072462 [Homalodisca vitripennis]|nr:hypothetical protein J6590_072462 [Homalodisca vitripennis]